MIKKPMLAGNAVDRITGKLLLEQLRFPLLATPKLDGIRCLKVNGKAVSRSFKPIANDFIRGWIEANVPEGLDGELIVENVPFSEVAGFVGSYGGKPDFRYYVFDYVKDSKWKNYSERMGDLRALPELKRVVKVLPVTINNYKELMAFEEKCIEEGYEGVMVRSPGSPYKEGRSTLKEGYLLKIKRFVDAEAVVIGFKEGMSNKNEAFTDELGHTKRSSEKAGKVAKGTLGSLIVRDVETKIEFNVSGFTAETAQKIWNRRKEAIGKLITYKHQPAGAKNAPRHPIFKGFREKWDL